MKSKIKSADSPTIPTKSREEIEAEIQDIRRIAHADAHIWTRTPTKGCRECARLAKEQ
jgi:hypothetical protein